jgi:hypothetical protein
MYAGMQPAQLLEQQQFLLAQAQAQVQQQQLLQAQQQQLFANGVQQQSPSAPVFTFHALPAHLQQQQQNSDASVSAADGSAGAPDLLALAAAWPQYAAAAGQASSTLGPMSPHAWAASAGLSPAGAMFSPAAHSVLTGDGAATAGPAVAAAAPARRGRGRGAAAAAAGADKPKAPSQRFR